MIEKGFFTKFEGSINFLNLHIRECRGLIFNKETGKVVARRLHKFFNIGESEETQANKIDFSLPHVLVEKVDG